MTIFEAVELVLQASELAQGGEVFLLDMGKPIKIFDLAVKMIIALLMLIPFRILISKIRDFSENSTSNIKF